MLNYLHLFLKNHLVPLLVIGLIGFPFSLFFFKVFEFSFLPLSEWAQIFFITLSQAFLSLILSFILAFIGTLGLLAFAEKKYFIFLECIYLIPILLPAIVIVGSMMNVFENFVQFPFGLLPLVFCHALSYSGAISVFLARIMMTKCFSICEWARVHGTSRFKLFFNLIRFVIKTDVQLLALTVFCFCFTSFSIPVLMGGPYWRTIEVAIYEYLKDISTWPFALTLLVMEVLFIFLMLCFI